MLRTKVSSKLQHLEIGVRGKDAGTRGRKETESSLRATASFTLDIFFPRVPASSTLRVFFISLIFPILSNDARLC
ncbi:MAG: hypothetical protein RMX35_23255 [Nostoc sp. DcaGUA01]|nr:hypothetical protein [Nostoc sp. DcaGUA01]